jgi:hypothetical protein
MPNGNPHFHSEEEPELEAFFARIADTSFSFASRHDLKLEKYYHDAPVWSFLFRHPQGGIGKLDLAREGRECLKIWCHWWRDDYETGVRFLKRIESPVFQSDASLLEGKLEEALGQMLSWKDGEWDSKHGGFKEDWQRHWTKAAFTAMENDYPAIRT